MSCDGPAEPSPWALISEQPKFDCQYFTARRYGQPFRRPSAALPPFSREILRRLCRADRCRGIGHPTSNSVVKSPSYSTTRQRRRHWRQDFE
jgi:hypothetical protein